MSLPPPPPSPGGSVPEPPPEPPVAPLPAQAPEAPTQAYEPPPAQVPEPPPTQAYEPPSQVPEPPPTQAWGAAPPAPPPGQPPEQPGFGTAPPAPPPKPRSKKPWVIVGVIVLAVVGIIGFTSWQRQQTFEAGHAAYLAADCATAVDKLSQVSDGDDDTAAQAAAEQSECSDLLAAEDAAVSDPARAVLLFSEFITKLPSSPLAAAAKQQAQAVFADNEVADIATTELCDSLSTLEAQQLIGSPETTLPPLLIACGNAYEADSNYTDALIVLDRFLTDFKDHELASTAEEAFARVTIADAAVSGAGELPAPSAVGDSGEAGDLVKVVIQNDSPNSMSLVFKGPDTRVERLEPCTNCEEFSGDGPDACPEKGPIGEYVMKPGTYDVVVKAADDAGVIPFRGTWELTPGDEFYSCFYLVTN